MTRLQQARFLAQTDPYWSAYIDGLVDKHNVRDPEPAPRRESWDSDWGPVPTTTPEPTTDEMLTNMARVIASTGHPAPKETP